MIFYIEHIKNIPATAPPTTFACTHFFINIFALTKILKLPAYKFLL